MKLTFCGGARAVTGANYLLESGGEKILIDCGLAQGSHYSEAKNFEDFPYGPAEITSVLVTHAHIDHIGQLPKLYKKGFRGKIYSTPPTKDFGEFLLLDSEHVLREEASKRHHKPALYDIPDVTETMRLWQEVPYHKKTAIGNFTFELVNAGHILGSASIVVEAEGKKIVFSGDLGNVPDPLLQPTEYVSDVDYALIESVYGNRVHKDMA